jgi:hypothetical protein
MITKIMPRQPIDTSASIESLIADLNSKNGMTRQYARNQLIKIGEPAVEALIHVLKNETSYAHWEAAKALSLIGSPLAVQTLVETLEDDKFSVRWLAAEGLITMGYNGLEPLLEALINKPDSVRLREGAHHVLYDLLHYWSFNLSTGDIIKSVLDTLQDIEPSVQIPIMAKQALEDLQKHNKIPAPVPKSHLNLMHQRPLHP